MEQSLYINQPDISLYEMYESLGSDPSPRQEFFWQIVKFSGKSPLSVNAWLNCGVTPGKDAQRKIADGLGLSIDELFPKGNSDRDGSMIQRYKALCNYNVKRREFIEKLALLTSTSPATVKRWLNNRMIPKAWCRMVIADSLNISQTILFPSE